MDDRIKLMQCMARLSRNPDFEVFHKLYLSIELEKAIDGCVTATEPAQFQGAAQALRKLINDVAKAEELAIRQAGPVPLSLLANAY